MRIMLVQPPFTVFKRENKKCHPPLGLAYLCGALEGLHEVMVLDSLAEGFYNLEAIGKEYVKYGLSFNDIKRRISDFSPDIVGISCLFSAQVDNVYQIAKIAKEVDEKIITIIGGAHPSAEPEGCLRDKNVDFVVIGEGEGPLKTLLGRLEAGKDFREVNAIGFRSGGRMILNRKKTPDDVNIDGIPFPRWDIFPLEKYFAVNNPHGAPARRVPFLPMITSRGCPFDCVFCSVHNIWGRGYKGRSPKNVLSEIRHLIYKFGIKEILFEDDNLTLDKERAVEILQGIIDNNFDIAWSVPNGIAVQTLDEDMLRLMKKSGCYRISVGIESGDEEMLRGVIKKPIGLDNIKPLMSKARKIGLDTVSFFVVGLPGENEQKLKKTFRFAESIGADNTNFFFATPLPGTRLLDLCKEKKLIEPDFDYKRLKSDYPSFSNGELSMPKLYSSVYYERLKLNFLYSLKRPLKALSKVLNKLKCENLNLKNAIDKTSERYSFLWSRYRDGAPPNTYHFDSVQNAISEKIVRGSVGLDLGCGCGWDIFIMSKKNPSVRIIGLDISEGVYVASKVNNESKNVNIAQASAANIPLKDEVCDFVYSFGVLHHMEDYERGLLEIRRVLKKGSPSFLYLYEDHSENPFKYAALKTITAARKITIRIPPRVLYFLSVLASPIVVLIFSCPAKILKRFAATYRFYEKIPFNFGTHLFSVSGDIYDRFSAPIEHRFNRQEIHRMLVKYSFENIHISRLKDSAGWVIWGYKNAHIIHLS